MTIYILKNADPEMGLFFMQKYEEEKYQKFKGDFLEAVKNITRLFGSICHIVCENLLRWYL
mgnify:CR=1 FL=1